MWNQYESLHKYVVHIAGKSGWTSLERVVLYSILHTRKDGSAVNEVVKEKMVSFESEGFFSFNFKVSKYCS